VKAQVKAGNQCEEEAGRYGRELAGRQVVRRQAGRELKV